MTQAQMTVETARETFDDLTETQRSVYLAIEGSEGATKEVLGQTFRPQVVGSAVKGLVQKGLVVETEGVFSPAFDARFGDGEGEPFVPELIRTRTARSSGVAVQFWKMAPHSYKAVCGHGTETTGDKRYDVARDAANPDRWCPECAKLAAERAEAKAAKKAERAKAKAAKAKAKKAAEKADDDS